MGNWRRDLGSWKRGRIGGVGGEVKSLLLDAIFYRLGSSNLFPQLLKVWGTHSFTRWRSEQKAAEGGKENKRSFKNHIFAKLTGQESPLPPPPKENIMKADFSAVERKENAISFQPAHLITLLLVGSVQHTGLNIFLYCRVVWAYFILNLRYSGYLLYKIQNT